MVTTDLGACEWFVWDLRRSNLLDRGQLDQVVGEFLDRNPRTEPPALAQYLVSKGFLTQFQADRLLQGKTQGFVLGPFTLMDALGAGSMGTVYKARSKNDNEWYAVKVLPRRSMWNVRIARRKVRAFDQCKHPGVVPFVDVGTSGGMHYLAWPFVQGETLDKVIERDKQFSPHQALSIALGAAEALDVCHQQGLFHGMLKPSNLMVGAARPGTSERPVYVLDFGIGLLLAESEGESLVDTMSTANSVSSGLDCASPESIMDPSNLSPRGDQYSLGVVLYYCLTGRYPFPEGTAAEKMLAIQIKQPTPIRELLPTLPDDITAVVERLMQKTPESRYASMAEAIDALRSVQGNAPTTVSAATRPAPSSSGPRSSVVKPNSERPRTSAVTPRPSNTENPLRAPAAASSTESPRPVSPPPPSRPAAVRVARPGPAPDLAAESASSQPSTGRKVTLESIREQTPPPPDASPAAAEAAGEQGETISWDERLGPIGVAIAALVACAVAWLLTWKLF
jgi:serine/threonine protein kinase